MKRDPYKFLAEEFEQLESGVLKAKHEYHSFSLSSIRGKRPESRTVVLRNVNKKNHSISFNTDKRSQKYNEITLNNNVSALFYDKPRKVQLRISGKANIENNNILAEQAWSKTTLDSKLCYLGPYAPSQTIEKFKVNLPLKPKEDLNKADLIKGFDRFCKVDIVFEKLDWLHLSHEGHQRIQFTFDKNLKYNWIAP